MLALLFIICSFIMSSSHAYTIVVGLNGALQKRFVLAPDVKLVPGNVHRAADVQTGVGGKGQDVAITLSCLGYGETRLAQFVGMGAGGDAVMSMLNEKLGVEGATALTVRSQSPMRTCTTIVASDESTELVEPSGSIQEGEQIDFFNLLKAKASETAAICIMGSMPPGCPKEMYANIYEHVSSKKTICVIDSVEGLFPLLNAIAKTEERGAAILKINASELCRLAKAPKGSSEAGGITPAELMVAVTQFLQDFSPSALAGLAITDGKYAAHFVVLDGANPPQIFRIDTPKLGVTKTLYPIGAGDSVAAGTLAAWRTLEDPDSKALGERVVLSLEKRLVNAELTPNVATNKMMTSFAFGLACGSASCLQEQNSVVDLEDVLSLFEKMDTPVLVQN
jgi:fructose-1-phosphate kinase PfkB-like protein